MSRVRCTSTPNFSGSLSSLSRCGKLNMIIAFVLWLSHSLSSAADLCATPRPSLIKYHTRLLTLIGDGGGGWTLSRIGTAEERMGIDREIATLEDKLAEVED